MATYIDEINQFFWSLTIFILFTVTFIFLSHSLKRKEYNERLLMLGFTGVCFGLAFNQLFWFLSRIFMPFQSMLDLIAILSFAISMTFFFFIFDKIMKKTRYVPFMVNIILFPLIIISFFTPFYNLERLFPYISYLFNATTFLIILLWFSMKSSEEFKIVSILLLTGSILYLIGAILSSIFIKELISITPLISYFFLIAGAILFVSPVFIKPKEKSQIKIALIICSIIYIISLCVALYFIILFFLLYQVNYIFLIIIFVVITGSSIIFIHFILNIFKLRDYPLRIDIEEEIEQRKDILSIFSRPTTITEEEISISKEKRICLVCKKKLSRDIYICPDCSALYCKDCTSALIDIENACWVCNTPLDPLKPIKLLEQTIKVEDKKGKMKKIAIITITDLDFYDKVDKFKWDEEEKKEFIKFMHSLSILERNKILNEMIEMAESLKKGEGYFEEDLL